MAQEWRLRELLGDELSRAMLGEINQRLEGSRFGAYLVALPYSPQRWSGCAWVYKRLPGTTQRSPLPSPVWESRLYQQKPWVQAIPGSRLLGQLSGRARVAANAVRSSGKRQSSSPPD